MSATSPVVRHPHISALQLGRRATAGVTGGIAGGLVFGLLMVMMGMLPMIASLVGLNSAGAGFGIHMVISVLIGLGLTVCSINWRQSQAGGVGPRNPWTSPGATRGSRPSKARVLPKVFTSRVCQ